MVFIEPNWQVEVTCHRNLAILELDFMHHLASPIFGMKRTKEIFDGEKLKHRRDPSSQSLRVRE
jgi:hypothetical protein